ncbi:MAG: DUF308 domain-containing protein [Methanoregula sp.]|nr:DUF308 domain-containing protein [Methanoregula sp.]
MHEPHPLRWKSMLGLGLISFLVGLFLLFFPGYATGLFVVFAGIAIIVLAAIVLVEGLFLDHEGVSRWGVFILGILGILLGLVVIAVPSLLVIATGLALGLFLVCFGIIEVIVAYILPDDLMVRLVIVITGLFAILLGVVIIINPTAGIDTVILLIGLYLVVLGMMRVAHGITERHAEQNITVRRL